MVLGLRLRRKLCEQFLDMTSEQFIDLVSPPVPERVQDMIDKFVTLYTPASPSWSNITELASVLGWADLVAQTSSQYLDAQGISRKFSREIIEAATRVNYGQNLDEIHALEGFISMAASGASSVKGGNFQIFKHFLGHSGANVFLNTTVRIF